MKCKDTKSEINALKRRINELENRTVITFMGFVRFMVFIGSVLLAYANIQYIFYAWDYLGITSEASTIELSHLLMVYPMLAEYFIIFGVAFAFAGWVKGGYDRIKGMDEDGLLAGLVVGLLGGLLAGLVVGLLAGLLAGLVVGLLFGLLPGLLGGLLGGLLAGLVVGLLAGLLAEFSN